MNYSEAMNRAMYILFFFAGFLTNNYELYFMIPICWYIYHEDKTKKKNKRRRRIYKLFKHNNNYLIKGFNKISVV